MARTMNADDRLYRVVVTYHREHGDFAYYNGPYTRLGTAKTWGSVLKNRAMRYGHPCPDVRFEIITAGSYSEPIWETVQ